MTVGLYAGSFDPPHLGHLALIEMAARWCDPLFVVATGNPNKLDHLFDLDARRQMLAATTAHLDNVVALHHTGLVVDLARELDVDVLIRGMGKDQVTEFEMAAANQAMAGLPTVFLPPDAASRDIASRTIRADYLLGGVDAIAPMVPRPVLDALLAWTSLTSR